MPPYLFVAFIVALLPIREVVAQPVLGVHAGVLRTFTKVIPGDQVPQGVPFPDAVGGWGYHGSFFAEFGFGQRFFLRPELGYALREHRYDADYDTTIFFQNLPITARADVEVRVRRAYVELPVLAGYRLTDHLSLVLGPSASWLLSGSTETDGSLSIGSFFQGLEIPLRNSSTATSGSKDFVPALVAGLDLATESGFTVGLRYWHGLGTLEDDTAMFRTHQHMLRLSVGYAFLRKAGRSGTDVG